MDHTIEDAEELRMRAGMTLVNSRLPFSFTPASTGTAVEGVITNTRSGQEGPTSLTIRARLIDGTRAKLFLSSNNDEPVTVHFFRYGSPEKTVS